MAKTKQQPWADSAQEAHEANPPALNEASLLAAMPDPRDDEILRLREQIARMQEQAREAQARPAAGLRAPGRYRVSLEGAPVLIKNAKGVFEYQDHLDVEAISAADAFEQFKMHNGILGTIHNPKVELLSAREE